MKILPVSIQHIKLNSLKNSFNKNAKVNLSNKQNSFNVLPFYFAQNYLTFCGGYSINLSQIYEKLNENEYPSDIRDNVEKVLNDNNPDNKTLYDIHFEKYQGINDCFTLDELKQKYPEFKDVVSAYDVEAEDKSFLKNWQDGKSDLFPQDEDLTLQLIKLYWGRGFSLNGLSKYIENFSQDKKGINLYHTINKKLNIPSMNPRYARVLALSNKEYNEQFTKELSQKIALAKEQKIQQAQGEAVFIPRGPLSESHRQHISEGLKRYYQNNPEAIYRLSVRQREFFRNNPDQRMDFSEALDYAWNVAPEGKSIKKHLSKFAKKYNREINDRKLNLEQELSQEESSFLVEFWKKNGWASEKFSEALKQGWEYVRVINTYYDGRSENGVKISFNTLPSKNSLDTAKWAREHGKYVPKHFYGLSVGGSSLNELDSATNKMLKRHMEMVESVNEAYVEAFPDDADNLATTRQFALIKLKNDLEKKSKDLPETLRQCPEKIDLLNVLLERILREKPIYKNHLDIKYPIPEITNLHLNEIYKQFIMYAFGLDCVELAKYMDDNLNQAYEFVINKDADKMTAMLR